MASTESDPESIACISWFWDWISLVSITIAGFSSCSVRTGFSSGKSLSLSLWGEIAISLVWSFVAAFASPRISSS